MVWIIALLVLVLAIALGYKYLLPKLSKKQDEIQYRTVNALFSPAERTFLAALDEAVGNKHRVLGKVRVADAITPIEKKGTAGWYVAFNRIKARHFDFVLCDPADYHVIAVVELDDSSHGMKERSRRDHFLNETCEAAELPLIRFPVQAEYDSAAIRERLSKVLWAENIEEQRTGKKMCPKCGKELERITGTEGALAGKSFWRCSSYPECRTVIPIVP